MRFKLFVFKRENTTNAASGRAADTSPSERWKKRGVGDRGRAAKGEVRIGGPSAAGSIRENTTAL